MKLFSLQLIFVLICSFSINAQNNACDYSVSGQVLDVETKVPIAYAVVRVEGTEKFTTSDFDGNFKIEGLCSDSNILIISCLGYADSTTQDHEHDADIHFYLKQAVTGLDEVTIKAQKIKEKGTETIAQVDVGKVVLKENVTQSLAAALSKIQGVTFNSTGANVQLPVIHGLSGSRILILNNGLRQGFQNWGRDHAPEIDLNSANNVTVIKGASGVRFGPEALGGVIIVEPNPLLLNQPLYGSIGSSFQTNGNGYNTNFEIGKGSDKWSYYANGNYVRIGDRRASDYNLTNTGKEEIAFGLGTLYHQENWDFKVNYSFVDQDLGLLRAAFVESADAFIEAINATVPVPADPFSYDITDPNQKVQHHLAKAEVNWRYSPEGKLTFIAGAQLNKRDEFDVRRNADLPIIDLDLVTYDYKLEWKHPEFNGLNGLLGIQYFTQNSDNNPGTLTTPFIPNYNTERLSAFAAESKKFGENTIEAGLRLDFESNNVRGRELNQDIFRDTYDFNNLTASIGYSRKFSDNTTFRTNLGTALRTPNVAELFSFGQNGYRITYGLLRFTDTAENGFDTSEVINLDDSEVETEVGYKLINELQINGEKSTHNFTTYFNYIDNYVFQRPLGVIGTFRGPTPAFFYNQADAVFIGLDYDWKKDFTPEFSGTFGFSFLYSRNVKDSETLINQPPIATNIELQWNQGKFWKFESSKFTLKPSYTFKQFQAPRTISPENLVDGSTLITTDSEIFDFIDAPDGYFLVDLSWNFKFKKLSGGITAQNLLNTSYRNNLNDLRYFADDLGRNILFKLNYKF